LDPVAPDSRIRFGADFELDPRAWELRRDGRALRLERIPMEILLFLARQPGQLVSREQIVEKIWGKRVFLDTDNSINGAMRKIRHALEDDPENPRFIQTVTGLGYRFVAQPAPAAAEARVPAAVSAPASATVQTAGVGPRWIPWAVAIAVLAIIAAIVLWQRERTRHVTAATAIPAPVTMIAVLPLENLTGDAHQDYFSDGLTDELIAQLGDVDPKGLSVIARTSVMRYKHTHTPVDEIGRALGAQYILEGSVRRDADNVRVTAQLVRASDQAHVWARQYDRKLASVLALQGEIAAAIADEIHSTLGEHPAPAALAAESAPPPGSYAAYDLYLQGRYYWNQRSSAGFSRALDLFQQSIAQDPRYAPAYAGLADTYAMLSNYGYAVPTETMPKAKAAALRALELDSQLAAAHNALAVIAEDYDYDWRTAEKEFQRAIELNPNYATAHQWYADCLAYEGRFAQALTESDHARALDPLSAIVAADRAVILHYARQYDRAIQAFQAVLAMDPRLARGQLIIEAYVEAGRPAEALSYLQTWRALQPGPWIWASEAYIRGRMGQRAGAEAAMRKMDDAIRALKGDPLPMRALAYAGVADTDKLLATLEAAWSERSNLATTLKVDPVYDFLRDDPRFIDLMHRAGLR
jgi:TolB-like protein/DNA-binding winged helix-turn-helix (wHTH) protein/Tfp pilus assembly protein PilF